MVVRMLLPLALLLAITPPAGAGGGTGLVTGQVLGPARNIQCVRAPCLEPAPGVPLAFVREGVVVARTKTDAAGRYRVSLEAGWYAVRGPRVVRVGLVDPKRFRVDAGKTLRLPLRVLGKGASPSTGKGAATTQ